jgi:SAM-dependent methyltransferase
MNLESKITGETVRADFNAIDTVVHYTRAAHSLGLWDSEHRLIERYFPDRSAPLLEAGCGAGRIAIGLWRIGYRNLTAFDFAEEMIDQAKSLAAEHNATGITFLHADATHLPRNLMGYPTAEPATGSDRSAPSNPIGYALPEQSAASDRSTSSNPLGDLFAGVLFLFNGLMQIPGRERRRAAMRELHRVCRPGAHFLFTTHDRDADPVERAAWAKEAIAWSRGEQNPRLLEFGDRYFNHDHGCTFMHLPDRAEILEDLAATGWQHVTDSLRDELARERRAVRDFSDNCRFWVARKL